MFAKAFALGLFGGKETLEAMDFQFMAWVSEHGRSYGTVPEYVFRREIYAGKDAVITAHNADPK